jgi:hypothetical protein
MRNFEAILLTTRIKNKSYVYYQIPVSEAKKLIKLNYSEDGKENHWIDTATYEKFKVIEFNLNVNNGL